MTRSSWKVQCASLLKDKISVSNRTADMMAEAIGKAETFIRGNSNSQFWDPPEDAADYDMHHDPLNCEMEPLRPYY